MASISKVENTKNDKIKQCKWSVECKTCKQPVTVEDSKKGNALMALGVVFHADHFQCSRCNDSLIGRKVYEFSNEPHKPLCKECYLLKDNLTCFECNRPLSEKWLVAFGKRFHKDCFKCKRCRAPIKGQFHLAGENMMYDKNCFYHLQYRVIVEKNLDEIIELTEA